MEISSVGPFPAGSYQSLTLVYTAGKFGVDDTGHLRVCWRVTSDMGKPQFTDPAAANYTTITASNGAKLDYAFERSGVRPWTTCLMITVGRGFLRKGETITICFGDRGEGSPGFQLQTTVEKFEFKTFVDAFASGEYTELPSSPKIDLIPGPATRWKALLPSQNILGEKFRLCIVSEDRWGNPTGDGAVPVVLLPTVSVQKLNSTAYKPKADGGLIIEELEARAPGTLFIDVAAEDGTVLCRSTPMKVLVDAPFRHFWGDLHGQSGETVGTNPARDYFTYARDKAFLDIVGHQGNDFQITDDFWSHLNALTAEFDVPGKFVAFPGYEWSGNTGMGGDRNVFYRSEGRPIRRSSRILIDDPADNDCYTANELFDAMARDREDAVVIAHVGGRYADLGVAHDGRFERAVEIHSTWGTFEWLLHDAFDLGYRPGIVCHSDDHKGRQGATMPGASTFGAIGGLTCYLASELNRDSIFETLRARRQYGTTGTRIYLSVKGNFESPVTAFGGDPSIEEAASYTTTNVEMGAIVAPGTAAMTLAVEAIGSAPIERIDIFHGKEIAETFYPFDDKDLGRRVRVMWSGAEYRGRGREVLWKGKAKIEGNRIERISAINFLNPDRPLRHSCENGEIAWESVTTGNMAGFNIWLENASAGKLAIETNIASLTFDLSSPLYEKGEVDAGGLGRKLRVYRLPEESISVCMTVSHHVEGRTLDADLPVYVRVTQEDGHQAWSSPIYLIPVEGNHVMARRSERSSTG
ncbi:DUF3604 domain-containing protein (plasmid) [Agrobacterium vitis]|uniref:DUF3604 domain-containing protein n=1 Tax=Agrobacterium vitis TaxID=373 RepID=UPI003D2E28FD